MEQNFVNQKITDGNFDQSLAVKCINGTFVGKKADNIISYKGIPFVGQQPVGNLRWKAPVDVTPNDGVYEAYYYGKAPVQEVGDPAAEYGTGEDCLYLNVWKADKEAAKKKPVIVWIFGGGFDVGGTTDPMYDCTNLLNENPDVIVVTISYRINVFGFFHLSHLSDGKDYPDAQNLGLLDQLKGLKWVHENIAAFGGDPDNVTIWGESAGAGSCTLLPLIKGSHQYFKRVIAQSGAPEFLQGCDKDEMNTFMGALGVDAWNAWAKERTAEKFAQLTDKEKALVESYLNDIQGESYEPTVNLFSQMMFIAPQIRLSEEHTKSGGKSYTFYYRVESSQPYIKAGHASELPVVFAHPEIQEFTGRAYDETFSKTMRKMWIQFAKTGNPSLSAAESPDGKAHEWPLYDQKDRQVMVLDEHDIHLAKESELKIVDWERTYFLTNYYMP